MQIWLTVYYSNQLFQFNLALHLWFIFLVISDWTWMSFSNLFNTTAFIYILLLLIRLIFYDFIWIIINYSIGLIFIIIFDYHDKYFIFHWTLKSLFFSTVRFIGNCLFLIIKVIFIVITEVVGSVYCCWWKSIWCWYQHHPIITPEGLFLHIQAWWVVLVV